MQRSDLPLPTTGIQATHFVVARDIETTARFYSEVLGGEVVRPGAPTFVKFANIWIVINVGGGPTPDKPDVVLDLHDDPNRFDTFLNLRVADIHAVYEEWRGKGAEFLTPPLDNHGAELRCYLRDPDGRIIEVGQATGSPRTSASGSRAPPAASPTASRGARRRKPRAPRSFGARRSGAPWGSRIGSVRAPRG
jgi:catechol 2,3-dioxygenase-like lactoylglutathione lyase family enzyme